MKDLGPLHHFLGMQVQHTGSGLFLSQRQYMLEILDRAGMTNCKPCTTPVDVNPKLSADGPPVSDPTYFRSLAGALQYLTFTRPDISYAVQQVCLHMHDPREPHLAALKRILRYVRGTLHMGLLVRPLLLWIWWFTLMLTGLAVLTLASPPRAMRSSSATIWSLGLRSVRTPSLVPVLRPSTVLLPMPLQRPPGYANFCLSCTLLCARKHWCIATTSAPSTCLLTPFSISAPSMWRSIFTSFGSVSPSVMCASFTSPRRPSSPTSSPRGFLRQSSRSLDPV